MAKLSYDGFKLESDGSKLESASISGWLNLHEIAKALERSEPVPPKLARWLGEAILNANKDEKKLMQNLGLIKPKGRPSQNLENDWLVYGKKICDLEDDGFSKENAIKKVAEDPELDGIDRTTLQRWRDKYKAVLKETQLIDSENQQ